MAPPRTLSFVKPAPRPSPNDVVIAYRHLKRGRAAGIRRYPSPAFVRPGGARWHVPWAWHWSSWLVACAGPAAAAAKRLIRWAERTPTYVAEPVSKHACALCCTDARGGLSA
jgi:hypothetical protein